MAALFYSVFKLNFRGGGGGGSDFIILFMYYFFFLFILLLLFFIPLTCIRHIYKISVTT